ncbi:hypothetical protein EDC01DRAFT_187463 [Geopyxis carbonaria]|nr:hypothetical protein EDC01DRAFT_187463 [Geopyxis carbonaria]
MSEDGRQQVLKLNQPLGSNMIYPPDLLFKPRGIYVIVSDRGLFGTFHWGLYYCTSMGQGNKFHITNSITNEYKSGQWRFETSKTDNLQNSEKLILGLQIGVVNFEEKALEQVPAHITGCLEGVWEEKRLTDEGTVPSCRIWVKDAISLLSETGYVTLIDGASIESIEAEVVKHGLHNASLRKKGVTKSLQTEA